MAERNLLIQIPGYEIFGQENALIGVAIALREAGVGVCFLTHAHWGQRVAKFVESHGFKQFPISMGTIWSINLVRLEPTVLFRNFWAVIKTTAEFRRIAKETNATDMLVGNTTFGAYLLPALWVSRMNLIFRHGDEAAGHSVFHRLLNRLLFARANRHVANCEYLRNILLRKGLVADCQVIPNLPPTVWTDRLARDAEPEEARGTDSDLNLLYVGQIAEHKGVAILFDAFRILAPQFPGMRLDIVGAIPGVGSSIDSEMESKLAAFLGEFTNRVRHHGFVENPAHMYAVADVHLLPSVYQDPSPNVILEAKCAGVPSVAFRVGGVPELVHHEADGYICDDMSASGFADGVRWLASEPSRLKVMKAAARQDCAERFGLARFRLQWMGILGIDVRTRPEQRSI